MTPATLQFRPLEVHFAQQMLSWRYPAPYELYNAVQPVTESVVTALLRPEVHYMAVLNERAEMIAFRCFGPDAQVRGGNYSADALDLGGGLRPDLTGQGLGQHIIAAAMNYAIDQFHPRYLRTTVASFNRRATKVCERLGYQVASEFNRPSDSVNFQIMTQKAQMSALSIPLKVTL